MILRGSQLPKLRIAHADERIVLGTGVFDIMHSGHGHYFHAAKELGDVVVMSLLGDRKARQIKGPGHPVRGALERAELVSLFKDVDHVTVEPYRPGQDRAAFFETITKLQPDVFFGDHTWEEYAVALESLGVEFRMRDPEKIDSSTNIMNRLLNTAHVLPRPA